MMMMRILSLMLLGALVTGCVDQGTADSIVGSTRGTTVSGTPVPLQAQLITGTSGLPFGVTSNGVTTSIPVTIINSGTDLVLNGAFSVTASTGSGSAIAVTSDTCSSQGVLAGATCTFTVNFTPSASGSYAGYLKLSYAGASASAPRTITIPYTGSGIQAQPVIASAPSSWDFGSVVTSATPNKVLTISNNSTGDAVFQSASISGSGYSIVTDGCNSVTLTSSTTCNVTLQFSPLIPGSSLGLLTLNYQNLTGAPLTKTISLSGIGNVPQPVLTLSPSPQNFGSVATNTFSNQIITVSNNTSVSATIGTASVSGSGYSIVSNTCNSTVIGASASCTITVRFTPAGLGAVGGTLTVPFTSAQAVSYTVTDTLGGTGVTPTVSFSFAGFTGVPSTDTTALSATGVTLQWTAQASASYYRVTRTGGTGGTVVTSMLTPTTTATYLATGLLPNTTYQFKVNAYDSGDNSDGNSNWVSVTTPNVTGATFAGWSDAVATGSVYTDIGTIDNALGNTGANRFERNLAAVFGFDASSVNTGTGVITVGASVPTGMALTLRTDGTVPAGLTASTVYYAINVSSTTLKLASTYANALAGTAISLTSTGTGNATLMPKGVAKIGWDLFTFTPSGTATSYNIYRATSGSGPFTLIGTSTNQSYVDYQVSDQTSYFYKIYPVISGTEVTPSTLTDSVIEIYIPPQNMSLVHRWVSNREACTNLLGFTWPSGVNRNDNYSCAYTWGTGYAPNTTYSKSKWDIGYSYVMDRWQNGCKMKTMGSSAPSGGSTNDVYLMQGAGTGTANVNWGCYIKDSVSGWIPEWSALVTDADRALMRTNYPGYTSTGFTQSQAYTSCQQRSVSGITDSNGNAKLRLMRLHEATLARAVQGNNVNYRIPSVLGTIFSATGITANGSCNTGLNQTNTLFDGVTYPNPSTYSKGFFIIMNGSALTRNCYSRFEISNLWDNAAEWTGSQYYAAAAGTGAFTQSLLDAGDNLLENFKTDGVMGKSNPWNGYDDNNFFNECPTCGNRPTLPLFGFMTAETVGTINTSLGSRPIDFTKIDFGPAPQYRYSMVSKGSNNNGINLNGMSTYYNSTSRYQYSMTAVNQWYLNWDNNAPVTNRCVGQIGP